MLLASCQVLQTPPIQRVNIQSLEVITDMGSIQRLSLLFLEIRACLSRSQYHIMDLLTMGPRTTALLISPTTPLRRLSNNTATAWATTWLGKALIILSHPITHLPTWLIDLCCIKVCLRTCRKCHRLCSRCSRTVKLDTTSLIMAIHPHCLPNLQQEFRFTWHGTFYVTTEWRIGWQHWWS